MPMTSTQGALIAAAIVLLMAIVGVQSWNDAGRPSPRTPPTEDAVKALGRG
jgi:hypothetical protein